MVGRARGRRRRGRDGEGTAKSRTGRLKAGSDDVEDVNMAEEKGKGSEAEDGGKAEE